MKDAITSMPLSRPEEIGTPYWKHTQAWLEIKGLAQKAWSPAGSGWRFGPACSLRLRTSWAMERQDVDQGGLGARALNTWDVNPARLFPCCRRGAWRVLTRG